MRIDRTGFAENLAALNLVALNTTQQGADVVTSLRVVEQFAEHFDTGNNRFLSLVGQTDDLNFLRHIQLATLHTAGSNRTTASDGEDVFNRHQEGLVGGTLRARNVLVDSVHQLEDRRILRSIDIGAGAFQRHQSGALDNGGIVAREIILVEQLTNFHFNQFQQFRIVNLVAFVHEHNDIGNAHLTGQQDVLTGLRHGAVSRGHNQDGAIHLRRAGDHVLDIVGMAGAVHVRIVARVGLIFHVRGVDCDTTRTLFGSLVDVGVIGELRIAFHREDLGDRSGQGGFTMVYVTDGTNVYMRFASFEFFLCHWDFLLLCFNNKPEYSVFPFYQERTGNSSFF